MGCGYLVCLVLGLGGLGLLYVAQTRFAERRQADGWIAGIFGVTLTVGALQLTRPMQRAVAEAKQRLQREEAKPDEPWTWDPRWTDPGGIAQAVGRHGRMLVVIAVVILLMSVPMLFGIGKEIRTGNYAGLLLLILPLVSIGVLSSAALQAWRRKKYGPARFVSASVPVPFGSEVSGMVLVSRPVVANSPGRATLECHSTHVTRSGGKREHRQEMIAHSEREISPGDWTTGAGESRLFVQLPVRGGQPTTMGRAEEDQPAFEWRMRIQTPTEGADFVAEFVLPVFDVGAAAPRPAETVMASVRKRERSEVFRAAGIEEIAQSTGRGGTALKFAAGVGRSLVFGPICMALVFGLVTIVLWFSGAGFFALIMALFTLMLASLVKSLWWGGGETLWIEDDAVCVQTRSGPIRRVARSEIAKIEANKNVGAGGLQFFRLQARIRPKQERRIPKRVDLATMVRGDEAAAQVLAWVDERFTQSRAEGNRGGYEAKAVAGQPD